MIEDEGPGMDVDEIGHAAERFFRGHDKPSPGTGLGLAIVETVLKRAGGTLSIANRAEARGLSVTLTFPRPEVLTRSCGLAHRRRPGGTLPS